MDTETRNYNKSEEVRTNPSLGKDLAYKSGYFFEYLDEKAAEIGEEEIREVLDQFKNKFKQIKQSNVGEKILVALRRIQLFYKMLTAWWTDNFSLPWRTVASLTVALLYFINPVDFIPDFFTGIGLTDDAALISLCWFLLEADLKRYLRAANLDPQKYNLPADTKSTDK